MDNRSDPFLHDDFNHDRNDSCQKFILNGAPVHVWNVKKQNLKFITEVPSKKNSGDLPEFFLSIKSSYLIASRKAASLKYFKNSLSSIASFLYLESAFTAFARYSYITAVLDVRAAFTAVR